MKSYELKPTEENIFKTFNDDMFDRNKEVFKFAEMLNSIENNFSIAIDADWGSGKTFFVKQTMMFLNAQNPNYTFSKSEYRKQIVDKWISGQHIFDLTDDMKSQLAENGKAEGKVYVDNEDSTFIYSVSKNKNDYTLMTAKDGVTTYSNIELDGNETTHRIEGLVAGETYILRETKTPDGYATFEEQEFIADENKDTLLKMTDEDTKVEVTKQDITTKKELPGAHLKVTDEEGNTVDEWVSKEESHIIKNLVAGKSYTLTETIAPAKYKIAESVNFKVEDTGAVQKVIMYDELLPEAAKVVKTGDNTRAIGYVLMGLGCFVFALLIFKHKDE